LLLQNESGISCGYPGRALHRRPALFCHPLSPVPPAAEDFMSMLKTENTQDPQLASLVGNLGELIRQARQKVLRAVDTVQVQTCWQIGRHIVEFEQEGGSAGGLWQTASVDAGEGTDSGVRERL
jgi:hypothetical protein